MFGLLFAVVWEFILLVLIVIVVCYTLYGLMLVVAYPFYIVHEAYLWLRNFISTRLVKRTHPPNFTVTRYGRVYRYCATCRAWHFISLARATNLRTSMRLCLNRA